MTILFFRQSSAAAAAAFAVFAAIAGCASTGTPRPPSLHLPQPVGDLKARRVGAHVELSFTMPTTSTDRQQLAARKHGAGQLTAALCRIAGTANAPCTQFSSQPALAGAYVTLRDDLPTAFTTGPAQLLRYRVRILNAAGRFAGDSREAVTLAGTPPAPVHALAASTTARGVQVTWQRDAAPPGTSVVLLAQTPGTPAPRNLAVTGDPGGAIDTAPRPGDTVTYTVFRTRPMQAPAGSGPLGGTNQAAITVDGDPATVTATRAPNTFAPAPPVGLVAVAVQLQKAPPEIDLSWEPNTEPDLQGYLIDRIEAAETKPLRLTSAPIATLSFRDTAVLPGKTYRYTIVAVNQAGNRSQPGTPAAESLRP